MGKHSATETGSYPEPVAEPTQVLTPVPVQRPEPLSGSEVERTILLSPVSAEPGPPRARSAAPVRFAILGAIVATVMLSGLVWAVNRHSGPQITGLRVTPPTLSTATAGMLDNAVPPEGSSPTASPVGSASAPVSSAPSHGTSPTPVRRPTPTDGAGAPPTHGPVRPPATTGAPTQGSARLSAQFRMGDTRSGRYTGRYTVTNRGTATAKGWSMVVTFSGSGGQFYISSSDVNPSNGSGGQVVFTSTSRNSTVPAGGSVSFSFTVTAYHYRPPVPDSCTINGASC